MRAFSLIISLLLVVSVITYLQGGSFHHFIERKSRELGLSGGGPPPLALKSRSFRLCKTRIASLEWSNHVRIFEDKSGTKARWMSQSPGTAQPHELDYLDIEKWFGINCVVKVTPLEGAKELSQLGDFLVLQFVDGSVSHLKRLAGHETIYKK